MNRSRRYRIIPSWSATAAVSLELGVVDLSVVYEPEEAQQDPRGIARAHRSVLLRPGRWGGEIRRGPSNSTDP